MKKLTIAKIITGFIILFGIYHAAEYMMLFKNSAAGLLALQGVFFIAAWIIARWQTGEGLSAWGLAINKKAMRQLAYGLIAGFFIYSLYFFTCIKLQVEHIVNMPSFGVFIMQFCYLGFGTALTSLSEDIFTRAYLYRFLHNTISRVLLIIISALVYVLNHIYRLQDGWHVWAYLFIIGVFLMLAFVNTKSIWLTFGLHWSGNMVYHSTSNIITTENSVHHAIGLYVYILFLLLLIPVTAIISRKKTAVLTNLHQQLS
ncbi:CPBP family intramembrane glutamic endopeptidase [Ferruginibacter profundus]